MQQWSTFINPVLVARTWPTGPITDKISNVDVWNMQSQIPKACTVVQMVKYKAKPGQVCMLRHAKLQPDEKRESS